MAVTLDYAIPSRRSPLRFYRLTLATLIATAAFAFVSYHALGGARSYFGTFVGCATGRSEAEMDVFAIAPLGLVASSIGCLLAQGGGKAFLFCRTACLGALGQWLVAIAFILFR